MKVNCSPMFDSVYERKNIKVTFSDNFDTAHINNGLTTIMVDGAFFKDVCKVIDKVVEQLLVENDGDNGDQEAGKILWNTMSTALSEPYDNEEFLLEND